jgi:ABC-2 type transport system ATP-binding protein
VRAQPDVVRQLIGLAGQSAAIDEQLTVRENLRLFGRLHKLRRTALRRRVEEMIEQFDLGGFADQPAGTCSGGQRRRLDVVAALIAEPVALFLDEPTTGLDPRSRSDIWGAIEDLASAGAAIVLTTQYLEEADRLSDHVLIIDEGHTVAEGSPASLKSGLQQDVLEIRVEDDASFVDALSALGEARGLVADRDDRRLGVPVADGPNHSLDLLLALRSSGVSIEDFQLRRPSLDDVFLQITGSTPTRAGSLPGAGPAQQEKEPSR